MLVRLDRFGLDEETYWEHVQLTTNTMNKNEFMRNLHNFSKNPLVVAMVSAILHILDEISWELLPEISGKKTAISIMKSLPNVLGITHQTNIMEIFDQNDSILNNWIRISICCILKK